ncbi:hypothetical protein IFM89_027532 [Coptis chinensis]|uniref:Transposase MuDR plant domain-containing protein n=1 Tax=Coptis chinensis TaxID=261450 RepID=A0A835HQK6_9MAGN|nr:hypothetical protein IFM89_027532 [Coptis chinensis]
MDPHLESTDETYVIDIDDETIDVEEEIEFQSQSEDTHYIGANDVDVDREVTFELENNIVDNDDVYNIFHNDAMDDANDEGEMDVDLQIYEFVKYTRNLYGAEENEGIENPTLGTTNFSLAKGRMIRQDISWFVIKDPECKWFVNCSRKVDGHTLKLRLFNSTHTCEGDKNNRNVQAKAPWVANELEDFARVHPTFALVDLHNEIYNEYGVLISYWTAWRGRVLLLERIHEYLQAWRYRTRRGVGGSSTHVGVGSDDSIVNLIGEVSDNSIEAQIGEGSNSSIQAQTRDVVQALMVFLLCDVGVHVFVYQ